MSPTTSLLENTLLLVIIQFIVIVACSRAFSVLFRRMGPPPVCGEIAAGLILGPFVLGGTLPHFFHRVFDPSVAPIVSIMSQIGLIVLMFMIGLESDFGHLSNNRRTALSVSSVGILSPFSLGLLPGRWMHETLGPSGSWLNFAPFLAAAMSITAIPILGRIMFGLNIDRTRIGSLTDLKTFGSSRICPLTMNTRGVSIPRCARFFWWTVCRQDPLLLNAAHANLK